MGRVLRCARFPRVQAEGPRGNAVPRATAAPTDGAGGRADMAKQNTAGRGDRHSALWGTTKRDGQTRASVLWGNGGRGSALLLALLTSLVAMPLAAAGGSSGSGG